MTDELAFETRQVPNASDGVLFDVRAHVIEKTDGSLGLQIQRCIENDSYLPLHVPSGALMEQEWAFDSAIEARDALVRFWERLSPVQRYRLSLANPECGASDAGMRVIFQEEWIDEADVWLTEAGRDQ